MSSTSPSLPIIQRLHSATQPLFTLNNNDSFQLSLLTFAELDRLIRESFYAAAIGEADAFHASLNFSEVGRAPVLNSSKTVRYLLRPV